MAEDPRTLTTYKLARGGPSFDLPWPPARNPWNPAHDASSSSSGAGAAVATGMVLGALGVQYGRLDPHSGGLLEMVSRCGRHSQLLHLRPLRAAGLDGRGLCHPSPGGRRL